MPFVTTMARPICDKNTDSPCIKWQWPCFLTTIYSYRYFMCANLKCGLYVNIKLRFQDFIQLLCARENASWNVLLACDLTGSQAIQAIMYLIIAQYISGMKWCKFVKTKVTVLGYWTLLHLCAPPLIIANAASDGVAIWGNLSTVSSWNSLKVATTFSVVTSPMVQIVMEMFFFLMTISSLKLPKNPWKITNPLDTLLQKKCNFLKSFVRKCVLISESTVSINDLTTWWNVREKGANVLGK